MSCFHPLQMDVWEGLHGERVYKIHPYGDVVPASFGVRILYTCDLPCGHCIGCRQDTAKEWANRLLLESLYHDHSYFVTLTYNDYRLPPSNDYCDPSTGEIKPEHGTLVKRDLQLFIKRLRRYFSNDRIRFYACGEYGDKGDRPHYHLILFGLDSLDESKLVYFGTNKKGNPQWRSTEIEDIWSLDSVGEELKASGLPYHRGFCVIEEANYYSFRYVSSYVTSKVGKKPDSFWLDRGLAPPFNLMSRKPGLGCQFLEDHPELASGEQPIVISTPAGKVEFKAPRYFKKSFRTLFPNEANDIADRHAKSALDNKAALLDSTDLDYLSYLQKKEEIFKSRKPVKSAF